MTIYDIATATGFSISTVSRALRNLPGASPKTRAIVHASAEELRYEPSAAAIALAGGRFRVVGVVIASLTLPGCIRILEAASRELRQNSYDLLLIDCALRAPDQVRGFSIESLTRRVDAVLGIDVEFTEAESAAFTRWNRPMTSVAGQAADDSGAAGAEAVRSLLDLL